jgi:hypothetical protein
MASTTQRATAERLGRTPARRLDWRHSDRALRLGLGQGSYRQGSYR